jgi:L-seryl-tRNA(Ser) seleniumtransferase
MSKKSEAFKSLPGVDKFLASPEMEPLLCAHGKELVVFAIRHALEHHRQQIKLLQAPPEFNQIVAKITEIINLHEKNLKKVFNATGVVIHTNLGRAPLGEKMLNDSFEVLKGYNNLEFNLKSGERGNRNDHAESLLKFLTGAEGVLVVNNAAAAVLLILRAFAKGKEVVVSRGELVEIGGSFRIPDIMKASDCKMVEVATTNKTKIADYQNAIGPNTAMFLKVHKSNYVIKGFTQEVSVEDLTKLGKQHNIPVVFDLGTGLLRKVNHPEIDQEPNVKDVLKSGVDLVCFSGDKLMGGPQAGIITGKAKYIDILKKEPMLRALRVCKTTLALLETACKYFLNDADLGAKNQVYNTFRKEKKEILAAAELLKGLLARGGISSKIVESSGQVGGGSLPDTTIESNSVMLVHGNSNKERSEYAEKMYRQLLLQKNPVLGVLKQGNISFDLLTLDPNEINLVAQSILEANQKIFDDKKASS